MGGSESKALVILGIEINFAAWPNASSKKQIGLGRLTEIIVRKQTLRSSVGRMKPGLTLEDLHCIKVDCPVLMLTRVLRLNNRCFAILGRLLANGILPKAGNVLGAAGKLKQQAYG